MLPPVFARVVAVATLFLALPAAGQSYGPQPGFQPSPYQPGFQPTPYPPMAPQGASNGAPSMVGTWSGQIETPNGLIQQAGSFSPDGQFVSVGRMPNGFFTRLWGSYRAVQVGPNQLRVQFQLTGSLPREICQQQAGGPPQCQPLLIPPAEQSLVTFSSPDRFQSMSEVSAGGTLSSVRDNQPALLQVQAPQRWLTVVQPSPAPAPGPLVVGPRPYPSPTPGPYRSGCYNDDIQRSVCKYSGRLITSGGCLQCVN